MNVMIDTVHNEIRQIKRGGGQGRAGGRVEQRGGAEKKREE